MTTKTNSQWARELRMAFREDYADMRGWGWSHDRIAAHYGIKRDSLLTRCRRAGVYIPESDVRVILDELELLIASGRPFTVGDLPVGDASIIGAVLRNASIAGRIRHIGDKVGPHGGLAHSKRIWQAAQADMAEAS